jgi:hypothetical protein
MIILGISLLEVLREKKCYREEPNWLQLADRLDKQSVKRTFLDRFFRSRLVYYPGAGDDVQPLQLFSRSRAAFGFVYADHDLTRNDVKTLIAPASGSRLSCLPGYELVASVDLKPWDLVPHGWTSHLTLREVRRSPHAPETKAEAFALLSVFRRSSDSGPDEGADGFALLYICSDPVATYDALFCQPESVARPFCVVLDWEKRTRWDSLGKGKYLERVARRSGVRPNLLLVNDRSGVWEGYQEVWRPDLLPGLSSGYAALFEAVEEPGQGRRLISRSRPEKPWWI